MSFANHSHRRFNPLLQHWVLVSPNRTQRPWSGQIEQSSSTPLPQHDSNCYLCPGNKRAGGEVNPSYSSVFAFDNDFPSLNRQPDSAVGNLPNAPEFFRGEDCSGICRVLCYTPRHDLTTSQLSVSELCEVVDLWTAEYAKAGQSLGIAYPFFFENSGEMTGCSNPHPHCQMWATSYVPDSTARVLRSQEESFREFGRPMLQRYVEWELAEQERVISSNAHWLCVVPYWAMWPFETMIIPRRAVSSVLELSTDEKRSWAEILKGLLARYDALFAAPFPYFMGLNQHPVNCDRIEGVSLHQVFFPPALRGATVRKHSLGFDMCTELQRDLTPEAAAERLRSACRS